MVGINPFDSSDKFDEIETIENFERFDKLELICEYQCTGASVLDFGELTMNIIHMYAPHCASRGVSF